MIPACARIVVTARLLAGSHLALGGRNGVTGPCRLWDGAASRGGGRPNSGPYGSLRVPGVKGGGIRTHIVAAWAAGLIPTLRVPEGMHIDHRCERTLCIEPAHFEIVPALENVGRRWRSWKRRRNND